MFGKHRPCEACHAASHVANDVACLASAILNEAVAWSLAPMIFSSSASSHVLVHCYPLRSEEGPLSSLKLQQDVEGMALQVLIAHTGQRLKADAGSFPS